jgi:hypothetical protein
MFYIVNFYYSISYHGKFNCDIVSVEWEPTWLPDKVKEIRIRTRMKMKIIIIDYFYKCISNEQIQTC